jgi:catechol 2,3-dioxygenase-like lactoylglutathione lyase family enzyme
MLHHVSIRTADIHRSIAFYECLGFQVDERFTTGYTLACWLIGQQSRLELIQIPQPKAPSDAFGDEHYVGYYHLSFDLTGITDSLDRWLNDLSQVMEDRLQQPLQVILQPSQQMIGSKVYEVAFIRDPDTLPIELMRLY